MKMQKQRMLKRWSLYLLSAGALLMSQLTFAETEVDQTLEADPQGVVIISNTAGSVVVKGTTRNEVHVTGTLGDDVDRLEFERDGNRIFVQVEHEGRKRDVRSDLMIELPEGSEIRVSTVSADLSVEGVLGPQELGSVSGDIVTLVAASDVSLASVSGDLEATGQLAFIDAEANTVSGDIELTDFSGNIALESVSGDIELINGEFEHVEAETVSGDILYEAALLEQGNLEMDTVSGKVEVQLTSVVPTRFEAESFSGSIRNCFGPEAVKSSRYTSSRDWFYEEDGATARVSLESMSGTLRICR